MSSSLPRSVSGTRRVTITCPSCSEKHLVEVAKIPREGGQFTCRICMERIQVPPRDAVERQIADRAGREAARKAAARVDDRTVLGQALAAEETADDGGGAPGEAVDSAVDAAMSLLPTVAPLEVTCPHCGGSFLLGSPARLVPEPPSVKTPRGPAKTAPEPPAKAAPERLAKAAPVHSARTAPEHSARTAPEHPARTAPEHSAKQAPPGPRAQPGMKTVLIVEDTQFFQDLLRETLSSRYRTLTAGTPSEAQERLGGEAVDLVVLDLALEGDEDGLDVLSSISARRIPCLIFTARNESELYGEGWDRLRARGASDLLHKGINIEESLLTKVADLLETRRG